MKYSKPPPTNRPRRAEALREGGSALPSVRLVSVSSVVIKWIGIASDILIPACGVTRNEETS